MEGLSGWSSSQNTTRSPGPRLGGSRSPRCDVAAERQDERRISSLRLLGEITQNIHIQIYIHI